MRISDWSSDVCSSDLPPFEAFSDPPTFLGSALSYIHYGYNFMNLGSSNRLYPSGHPRRTEPARIDQLNHPSGTILAVDSIRLDSLTVSQVIDRKIVV